MMSEEPQLTGGDLNNWLDNIQESFFICLSDTLIELGGGLAFVSLSCMVSG